MDSEPIELPKLRYITLLGSCLNRNLPTNFTDEAIKEDGRAVWGWTWLDWLRQDVRYALRTLAHNRGFAIVAVLSRALAIGANASIFGVINAILLKSLPV